MGPLTLRQLIILAIGFGASYMLFAIISRIYELNILEYIVILLPAALSTAFALVRINDISLLKFFFLFLEFSIKPKKRVWDHRGILNIVSPDLNGSGKTPASSIVADNSVEKKAKQAANLRELTRALDSNGFSHIDSVNHHDIDHAHDEDLVTQAYFGHKKNETGNIYWRTKESHLEMLKVFAKMPVTQLKEGTKETELAKKEIMKVKEEVESRKRSGIKKAQMATKATPVKKDKKNEIKSEVKNKKPKRKRKRQAPQPVRPDHQINNTQSNKPVQYKKPPKNKESKSIKKMPEKGELNLNELSDGDTIEINLD